MSQLPISRCAKCGRPIVWIVTETNHKGMPIDPEPHPIGNVFLSRVNGKIIGHVKLKSEPRPSNKDPYVAHFVTCPALNNERPQRTKPAKPKPEHHQETLL